MSRSPAWSAFVLFIIAAVVPAASRGDVVRAPARCALPISRTGARSPAVEPIRFRGLRLAAVPASKVLLWFDKPTHGTMTITGARCADGTRMRFWYGGKPALPDTVTPATGDVSYTIDAPAGGAGMAGYTLWSKPGNWKLTVSRHGRVIGSLVFCVASGAGRSDPCA